MIHRTAKLGALAIALLLVNALACVIWFCWRSHIDPNTLYERIHLGDTSTQAITRVGFAPDDYRTDSSVVYWELGYERIIIEAHPSWKEISWMFDKGELIAYVNEDGVVVARQVRGSGIDRGRLDRLMVALRKLNRVCFD
jgi:hypothetical protein